MKKVSAVFSMIKLIVVAPPPDKPFLYYDHTKTKYGGVSGTPPIGAPREMYGVHTGQHLTIGLKCMFAGCVSYIDDPHKITQPPPMDSKSSELYETRDNGFYYEVLSH